MNRVKLPVFAIAVVAGLLEGIVVFGISNPYLTWARSHAMEGIQFLIMCVVTGLMVGCFIGFSIETMNKRWWNNYCIEIVVAVVIAQLFCLYVLATFCSDYKWLEYLVGR